MFYLLLAAWIVNLFDLGFTLLAQEQGLLVELNPVAARVIPHGAVAAAAYKLALLSFGTMILWLCRDLAIAERSAWVYAIVCVALAFQWHLVYKHADTVQMVQHPAIYLPAPAKWATPAKGPGETTITVPVATDVDTRDSGDVPIKHFAE